MYCIIDVYLDAVLTVSPNRQYLGILIPTTPATHGPVCSPILTESFSCRLWRISNLATSWRIFRDILAISTAWRSSLGSGRPELKNPYQEEMTKQLCRKLQY